MNKPCNKTKSCKTKRSKTPAVVYESLGRYEEHLKLRGKAGGSQAEYLRHPCKLAQY